MKNQNFTQLDTDQIQKRKFDEAQDADRVFLVGGEKLELSIDSDKIANAVKEGMKDIKFDLKQESIPMVNQTEKIQTIVVPQIEYRTIEVPVFVKEIEYREIEKPIIIEKIITVEKPIVIKEIEFRDIVKERHYPMIMKITSIVQAITVVGLLLINLLKK